LVFFFVVVVFFIYTISRVNHNTGLLFWYAFLLTVRHGWFRRRCCFASGHSSGGQQPLKMMEHSASDSETEDHVQPLLRRKDTDIQKGRKILTIHACYVLYLCRFTMVSCTMVPQVPLDFQNNIICKCSYRCA